MRSTARPKLLRQHQEILFGLGGNDAPFLGEGWADPEPGQRWTLGGASEIRMIHPGNVDVLLEIEASPALRSQAGGVPRLDVETNGTLAGSIDLPDRHRRAIHIPGGRLGTGQILTLRLLLPTTARPVALSGAGETRKPGVCLSRLSVFTLPATPAGRVGGGGKPGGSAELRNGSPAAVLACFEGVGEAATLERVQRQAGVRLPGPLSSASIALPGLIRALDQGFAELGEPGTFDVTLYPQTAHEYVVTDLGYAAEFRSVQTAGPIKLSAFMEEQGASLRAVRRTFMQAVSAGEKIFVACCFGQQAVTEQEILPLLIALNRHGPNHLLWVTHADAANPSGTVESKVPLLLHGTIVPAATVPDLPVTALEAWLELCQNALDVAFRATGSPASKPAAQWLAPSLPAAAPVPTASLPANVFESANGAGPSAPSLLSRLRARGEVSDVAPLVRADAPAGATARAGDAAPDASAAVSMPANRSPVQTGAKPVGGNDYALLQDWIFGDSGNEEGVLGFGWSGPEDGFRWTEGDACELWLDHQGKRDLFLVIEAWPLLSGPALTVQRAEISAHDVPLGTLSFAGTARQALFISASVLRPGRIIRLRLGLPDAARPSDLESSEDERQLGLGFMRVALHAAKGRLQGRRAGEGGIDIEAAQARSGLTPQDLLGHFESFGETASFADMQADCGAESQGLFRQAGMPLLDLVHAVETRFEGLGDPAKLRADWLGDESDLYEIRDEATGLTYVTERAASDASVEMMIGRQARRLKFLREQFLHDLANGDRIFIYDRAPQNGDLSEPEMLPLFLALRQHGSSALLFMSPSGEAHAPGTVEQLYPGLLRGYLDPALADGGDFEPRRNMWLEICANALALRA